MWNSAGLLEYAGFYTTYVLLMVPAFAAMIGTIVFFRRREVRVVREYLQPDLEDGLLSTEELNVFSSGGARRRAITAAKLRGGASAAAICKGYVDSATGLAFLRERRARSVNGAIAAEDERAYVDRLRYFRDQLRWHWETAAPLSMTATPPVVWQPSLATSTAVASLPVAAWYPDPWGQRRVRYWDGFEWTGYTSD